MWVIRIWHIRFLTTLCCAVAGWKMRKGETYDFILMFCPVISRVKTDIMSAMSALEAEGLPGGKPVVLVVLHHTFDPDLCVPDSSRIVDRNDVIVAVDCLFYETKGLLKCPRNKMALTKIRKTVKSKDGVQKLQIKIFRKVLHRPPFTHLCFTLVKSDRLPHQCIKLTQCLCLLGCLCLAT
uniref:Uncharacterized protein n=1 Tax=Myripristis murdjan TaxID=586833 RepID=A0A667ZRQ5_9TELE